MRQATANRKRLGTEARTGHGSNLVCASLDLPHFHISLQNNTHALIIYGVVFGGYAVAPLLYFSWDSETNRIMWEMKRQLLRGKSPNLCLSESATRHWLQICSSRPGGIWDYSGEGDTSLTHLFSLFFSL